MSAHISETRPTTRLTQAERLGFAQRRVLMPVGLFLGLTLLYLAMVWLALAAPLPLAIVLSPLSGVVIGILFIAGHDACHNSFTAWPRLNQIIGRIAFLPSLHSFTTWAIGHNQMHHRYNSLRGWDAVWEPLSPEDYRARGSFRRMLYRFHRSPAGVPFYYMMVLWAPYHCAAAPFIRRNMTPMFLPDLVLVLLFFGCQVLTVTAVGASFGHGALASFTIGIVVPFLVWNGLMSMIVFLHHTHPALHWYPDLDAWKAGRGAVNGSAHVRFASPIGAMVLRIMEHNAHHAAPGVPFYNLVRMQSAMAAREDLLSWGFSFRAFVRICKRCELYDYDAGRWVTFQSAAAQPVEPAAAAN